mmetsp:Transcript_22129/g.32036  ORF Transcript_22129/g.32036 Transcript_22129/m.32036 type:complete len:528 (-) Transcript_22129:415-1998(-)
MSVRVLVVGGASEFNSLVAKVEAVVKKSGPFSFVLIAGEVGASKSADLKAHKLSLPGYFASQSFEAEAGTEFEENNLTFIGEAGKKDIENLSVVFIAGGYDDPPEKYRKDPKEFPFPPEIQAAMRTAGALGTGYQGVDILVSGDHPLGINLKQESFPASGSMLVSATALLLKPRYHFCGGKPEVYASNGPFVVPGSDHATRLFKLGSPTPAPGVKERWLYAAAVKPLKGMDASQLEGSSSSAKVYQINKEGTPRPGSEPTGGFFYNIPPRKEDRKRKANGDRPGFRKRFEGHPVDAKCWFCLGNEKDLHLVINVGTNIYLALAKGGINTEHVLLIPILHVRSTLDLSNEHYAELEKFKSALQETFRKNFDSDLMFFERVVNPRGGELHSHTQIQAIPVPRETSAIASVKLGEEAQRSKLKIRELPKGKSLREFVKEESNEDHPEYFYIRLPDGKEAVQLISVDKKSESREEGLPIHPMQFGRRFTAALLGRMNRLDWKRCVKPTDLEAQDADRFRSFFSEFNPTGDE